QNRAGGGAGNRRRRTPGRTKYVTERRSTGAGELLRRDRRPLVLALESLDPSRRVHELLLPGVEGMALRAHFHPDLGPGRTGMHHLAARAGDGGIDIFRMNASLHGPPPSEATS